MFPTVVNGQNLALKVTPRRSLKQHQLHATLPQPLQDALVAEDMAEEVLSALGHIEEGTLFGIEMGDVEDEVG